MTCIRFALLGSGFIGQVHAASLARHERTLLAMVADADPERAKALASRYGARAVTVAEAINSDAIDAVLIASSTPSHAALLEAAARAGKANWFRWYVGHRLCRRWNICAAQAARCATRRFTSLTCCAFLPVMK